MAAPEAATTTTINADSGEGAATDSGGGILKGFSIASTSGPTPIDGPYSDADVTDLEASCEADALRVRFRAKGFRFTLAVRPGGDPPLVLYVESESESSTWSAENAGGSYAAATGVTLDQVVAPETRQDVVLFGQPHAFGSASLRVSGTINCNKS